MACGNPLYISCHASFHGQRPLYLHEGEEDLIRMVPSWVPRPRAVVFLSGICELLGAFGLLLPSVQRVSGIALILFFVAVFPANVRAARAGVTLRGKPATPLWMRTPMQILFIALTWWSTQ